MRDTGALGTSARNESSPPSSDDHGRAALGYLVWPIALLDILRSDDASFWSRLHARQATIFGVLGSAAFVCALAFPLLVVILFPNVGTRVTIVLYSIALAIDVVFGGALLLLSMIYAARASKGELFAIPVVTRLCDRFFPIAPST